MTSTQMHEPVACYWLCTGCNRPSCEATEIPGIKEHRDVVRMYICGTCTEVDDEGDECAVTWPCPQAIHNGADYQN